MTLIEDWQKVLTKAWSVKFNILAIIFGATEAVLPQLQDAIPPGTFAVLAALAAGASLVSRLLAQKEFPNATAK